MTTRIAIIFYKDAQDTLVRDRCEELVLSGDLHHAENEIPPGKITDVFIGEIADITTGPGWLALKFFSGQELTVDPKSHDYTILSELNPEAAS